MGVDVTSLAEMTEFRKTLNTRVDDRKTPTKPNPTKETTKKQVTMTLTDLETELSRLDLDANEARILKTRIDAMRALLKYQSDSAKLISRSEVEEHFIRSAMGIQAFLRRFEREIPALCLGLTLSQSMPLVKARTRELQEMLASIESEFWKEHKESEQ